MFIALTFGVTNGPEGIAASALGKPKTEKLDLCDHDGEGRGSRVATDKRVREKYRDETKLEETHQDLQCGVKYDKEHR